MKSVTKRGPIALLILFEAIVGIMLFVNPEAFTRTVITAFGILMLVIGVLNLLRWYREKDEGEAGPLTLACGVIALIVGIVCAFFTNAVMGLFVVLTAIYGVMLVIAGVYKLQAYFALKRADLNPSALALLSGIAAILCGAIIVFLPASAIHTTWVLIGVILLVEAVLDIIAFMIEKRV